LALFRAGTTDRSNGGIALKMVEKTDRDPHAERMGLRSGIQHVSLEKEARFARENRISGCPATRSEILHQIDGTLRKGPVA
jgi:hypothetical protein